MMDFFLYPNHYDRFYSFSNETDKCEVNSKYHKGGRAICSGLHLSIMDTMTYDRVRS